ncbi:aspartate kinase [Fluviicola taffensis]|uniref:Aspartokinase n=1 Tax=Fluviicola taffensis (strain DSM 16823 / NCIMB 13979 / RW262) TaxID=755732 RepID=F2IK31_FLUTR|nr:aspartate kinase [Fluviicola taffensis]AEA42930.1 aspartate kinase [Fluviicola taffensis DSM 16823]
MNVFKFGGASVKDANAVRNVSHILSLFPKGNLIVVVSAMGKTTNAMEEIVDSLRKKDEKRYLELVEDRYQFHQLIVAELFPEKHYFIHQQMDELFETLKNRFQLPISDNYNFEYDQIVSLGEVLSSMILEAFMKEEGHSTIWVDCRKIIRTDHEYREGEVDWAKTQELVNERLLPLFKEKRIAITQGFIGHTSEGFTTTLGREGSDFTAGILAYCTNANGVTIWKDVPGMLNADPKWFDDTIKLEKISFKEAIELSYYGASVIHPKTIKPLQNKGIPLYVKSFINPNAEGTVIQESLEFDHLVPSFIFKMDQVLMSFTPKDFSFIVEENLGDIFQQLAFYGVKINLMQNSALSFSILFDRSKTEPMKLVEKFKDQYSARYNEGLELVTIRHYDQATINRVTIDKDILLEQRTRQTIRMVMKNK